MTHVKEYKMAKSEALSIRIDPALKEKIERDAEKDGRSISSHVERILDLHTKLPQWILRDCQPQHRRLGKPHVVLPIAEGWPSAVLSADHAERLGEQLIGVAKLARKTPPAE